MSQALSSAPLPELSLLMPLIGVALGWVLSQFSSGSAATREDRRLRRSALPPMLELYFQQYRIDKILVFFNLRLGGALEQMVSIFERDEVSREKGFEHMQKLLGGFEKTRQGTLDLPEKNKESMFRSLDHAAQVLSKVDPVGSYRLSRLSNEFVLLIEIKFPNDNLSPKEYMDTWAGLLETFRNDIDDLRRLIHRTAFRVSLIEFIRVLLLLRKEERAVSDPPVDLLESVQNVIRKAQGSGDTPKEGSVSNKHVP